MNPKPYQILSLLCLVSSQAFTTPTFASPSNIQQGDDLVQRGLQSLNGNQLDQALQSFEEAYSIYKESNHLLGWNRALINKSVALKRMGQYYQACTTLAKVLSLDRKICQQQSGKNLSQTSLKKQSKTGLDTNQKTAALHNLGNTLRLLGQLESSAIALKQAYSLNSAEHKNVQLSLANTYQAQYKAAINQLSLSSDPVSEADAVNTAQTQAQKAITLYDDIASSPSHGVHAKLNSLQLILHLGKSKAPGLVELHQQSQHLIDPFFKSLLSDDFSQFPENEAINLQLKLSELLSESDQTTEAFNHARAALIKADALQDFRLESLSYGTLGKIYLQSEQLDDATKVFKTALQLAQANKEDSLAYQWSWQIAQIHQQQGHQTQAISAYDSSIQHLDRVRTTLISANSDLQFNYKESVEPVYIEYLKLLLSSPKPNLQLVLETHQQLQVAELENFLKCSKLDVMGVDKPQSSQQASRIHIFKLGDQIEVIAQTPQGIYRHQPDAVALEGDLLNFLQLLEGQQFRKTPQTVIPEYAQTIYQHLLGPIQSQLPTSGDLIFHLDSHFQNLPMSLLHDGQDYLIKNYSIQIALNTQLRQAQPTRLEKINVLFAGLSEVSPSFNQPNVPRNLNPLPEVQQELEEVSQTSNLLSSLLNAEFTADRLQTAINPDTKIVHIASHGQFSSDPRQTFLLAYDKPIHAKAFHDLLNEKSEIGQASLELLILSACQTAKGDRRSALGIAGLAVQAGSKNTLASLWLADSKSTTELITLFYQGLDLGLSKAEALQKAQIQLIDSGQYAHPYYWGNFILVGS